MWEDPGLEKDTVAAFSTRDFGLGVHFFPWVPCEGLFLAVWVIRDVLLSPVPAVVGCFPASTGGEQNISDHLHCQKQTFTWNSREEMNTQSQNPCFPASTGCGSWGGAGLQLEHLQVEMTLVISAHLCLSCPHPWNSICELVWLKGN